MLKIGVFGAGHLGKIHIKCIQDLPDEYQLVGFHDPDQQRSQEVSESFGIQAFESAEGLIDAVDVVDIVTPTLYHYEIALKAAKKFKHFFIEKPITNTTDEAKTLIKIAQEAKVKGQVGHVERFNPAFLAARPFVKSPMFMETHRLAEFNPRGTDVPVVLDLMIHDLDIVLSLVPSGIKRISANGVAIVSNNPDIANARIEFDNGCVANLTASRMSMKNMRKTRIFQPDAYITVDFLEKQTEIIRLNNEIDEKDPFAMVMDLGEGKRKQIFFEKPEVHPTNAIKEELRSFAQAINKNKEVSVSLEDGLRALEVATEILQKIELNLNVIA